MMAFVDESLRQGPKGMYLVAAVVVLLEDLELARERVRSVPTGRQPRFHWRNESDEQRRRMLACVTEVSVAVRAYVHQPTPNSAQARARALCLNRLLWDLQELRCDDLLLESRQEHNDQKDRRTIIQAQKAKLASPTLRYDFARPGEEPLLWLPDAMAGAIAKDVAEDDDCYVADLPPEQVTVTCVGP